MKIYTFPRSRSLRVIWTLEELEMEYEPVRVSLMSDSAASFTPHPLKKVPVLEDGDFILFETVAICNYLCARCANASLYPQNHQQKALTEQWLSFALTDLESPVWAALKHRFLLAAEKRVSEVADAAVDEAIRAIQMLENHVGEQWIMGELFTLADIFLSHNLAWAAAVGIPVPASLNDYMRRCFSRAAYSRALRINNS